MKTLSQIIESSERSSLSEFIFEGKSFTEIKRDVLKALGIASWDKGNYNKGIFPKLNISPIKEAPKKKNPNAHYFLSYVYNPDYDKLLISPNFSYLKEGDYEAKVINSMEKLASIEGCSYQIINSDSEYKKLVNDDSSSKQTDYPKVLISVPKSGDKPELPGIPKKKDDLKPKDKQKTEPKEEKNQKDKSIKFWCTGAGDTRYDYVAYGAMTPDWTPNFKRIQKRIGENKFTKYYTNLPTKTFGSYKSLYSYMKKKWKNKYSEFSIATEEKLIELASEESYYIKDYWS